MAKGSGDWQRNYVVLRSGDRIRYSLLQRGGAGPWFVRFKAPYKNNRLEKATGRERKPDAIGEAHRIIQETYQEIAPTAETVTWEIAAAKLREKMETAGLRDKTVKGYAETLAKLSKMFDKTRGPADITERHAADFATKYTSGKFTRKRKLKVGEVAPEYDRAKKSAKSRITTLKAVFQHFRTMKPPLIDANPFASVVLPKLDTEVKLVSREAVGDVFGWFEKRYPGWVFPKLFFRVKAHTMCRLEDLCSLPADAVEQGGIVWPAQDKKNRKGHYSALPAELVAELVAYKGPLHLWEKYTGELIALNKSKGFPTHRSNPVFSPRRLFLWVVQIMQQYQKETGASTTSHDFKKAGLTRAAEANIHPKELAAAVGTTTETILKYYTAVDQRRASEDVAKRLGADLDPTIS